MIRFIFQFLKAFYSAIFFIAIVGMIWGTTAANVVGIPSLGYCFWRLYIKRRRQYRVNALVDANYQEMRLKNRQAS